MKNNLILIGFMGSGKTTLGVKLSQQLKRSLIDTDKWIETKQAMSIADIFKNKGEDCFRQLETECLKELLCTENGKIIAVGGGLPLRPENRQLLDQLGLTVYLKVTPEEVLKRLEKDTTRPLLQVENPAAEIKRLLDSREAVYQSVAKAVIETTEREWDAITSDIMEVIKNYENFDY